MNIVSDFVNYSAHFNIWSLVPEKFCKSYISALALDIKLNISAKHL